VRKLKRAVEVAVSPERHRALVDVALGQLEHLFGLAHRLHPQPVAASAREHRSRVSSLCVSTAI
jgi:hypothetical protein